MARRITKAELPPLLPEEDEGLVPVTKDGEVLFVHPTTVEAHKAADWLPVE